MASTYEPSGPLFCRQCQRDNLVRHPPHFRNAAGTYGSELPAQVLGTAAVVTTAPVIDGKLDDESSKSAVACFSRARPARSPVDGRIQPQLGRDVAGRHVDRFHRMVRRVPDSVLDTPLRRWHDPERVILPAGDYDCGSLGLDLICP